MVSVSLYAALLSLLFVFLSVRTLRLRRLVKIPIGDGGNAQLQRAMRVHANFSEYVPLALVLILLVELNSAPGWLVHFLGVLLLLGRLLHAWGVSNESENFRFRVGGMACTFTVLILSSMSNLFLLISG